MKYKLSYLLGGGTILSFIVALLFSIMKLLKINFFSEFVESVWKKVVLSFYLKNKTQP